MKRRAFTLIELLVVISIISLLVSIALPSLAKARSYGKRVACSTNLKAIGVGWIMYRDDYPHSVPNATSLPILPEDVSIADVLERYVSDRTVWRCPNDDREYFQKYGTSYEYYLGFLLTADPTLEPILDEYLEQNPARSSIIVDAEAFHPSAEDPAGRLSIYHDGHVDWLTESEG